MAHDHLNHLWEDPQGNSSRQLNLTLAGGTLVLCSFAAQLFFESNTVGETERNFYVDSLAFVGALILGIPLIKHAFIELWHGHGHMDELVALGVMAAFATGDYQTAGAISFFMIISTILETRTAQGARATIESLIKITPTRAFKVIANADGTSSEVEVEAKDLKPGDKVRVRPGDNIPGDGKVLSGQSTVNQANLTGESLPVDKTRNDDVFGGTINLTGVLEIEITKAGADTTLGKVQELILRAESQRTPIARLIDRYANWYTPTILMLAGIVLFFTKNINTAIGMLVAACPCALVLATPTAMVAALSAAARLGILIKNVSDLEVARNVTAIVFDKTGTLTTGRLSVTRLFPAPGVDGANLLAAAALVEKNSKHPVAKAVVEIAEKARINFSEVSNFEEVPGRGARAFWNGQEILVGRASWLKEMGVDTDAVDAASGEGLSLLYVAQAGKVLGWIGLEDKPRAGAAVAVSQIKELNINSVVMVTGDRASVAKKVAAEMQCSDYRAEVLPGQKLEIVEELKKKGHTVMVVGDGVNDAPALAAGNVSLAMGAAGTDVAIHSASMALMNENLNRIPFLIELSRKTSRVVWQNLGFGILYIATLEVLIAVGYLPAIVAAILHVFGSVAVLFNSARLVREGEEIGHAGENVQRAKTVHAAEASHA